MYVPSFMAVMMAWSSFWIHRDEASARIKLGTLVVWTVAMEYVGLDYAHSEYMMGLGGQVWLTGCLSFCWLSFFMYIVVHVVRRREKASVKHANEKAEKAKEQERRTGERAFSISDHHPVSLSKLHAFAFRPVVFVILFTSAHGTVNQTWVNLNR